MTEDNTQQAAATIESTRNAATSFRDWAQDWGPLLTALTALLAIIRFGRGGS